MVYKKIKLVTIYLFYFICFSFSCCIRIELYSSLSPCFDCCNLIRNFILGHPFCEIYIAFTCVYKHREEKHTLALKGLNELNNIKLFDVFSVNEWCLLRKRGIVILSVGGLDLMETWDLYWRSVLKEILLRDKYQVSISCDYNYYFFLHRNYILIHTHTHTHTHTHIYIYIYIYIYKAK